MRPAFAEEDASRWWWVIRYQNITALTIPRNDAVLMAE